MPRVIHFEIHADRPDRAAAFYRELLGWKIEKWPGPWEYWMISTGDRSQPGIDGGLLPRRGPAPVGGEPVNAFVCTVDVADLDASIAKATSIGGSLALPKMQIPGVGWLAYVKDTEGNIIGMMQPESAH